MDQTRDGPVALSQEEIQGRNTWLVWTAGDDRLWDVLGVTSVGAVDFLKVVSSHPTQKYSRACDPARLSDKSCQNRWEYFGLVNEPCFEKATGPDPARWNLWLDKRKSGPGCGADPFENASKYPGVAYGSRGKTLNGKTFETGSSYGYASGIVGFRLFPNPAFDEKAAARWDAEKYYTDPNYANDKNLVRPYRVGMSCALCHVGPNPIKPPVDPNNPEWANLSSNVGAQYFWVDRIFFQSADFGNFAYQLFHASRPGTLDTSFISTDSINNPRTMNAVYLLGPRLLHAKHWGKETLKGGGLDNHQFNDYISDGPLTTLFEKPDTVWTPRVLKDGSDSVGALGALNRVYLNIGTFSEDWLTHFNALVGGKPITPITIEASRKNSAYFKATEAQTLNMAKFFLKTTGAHHLADAPGGQKYLTTDQKVLTRGKVAFAENCARCHSIEDSGAGAEPRTGGLRRQGLPALLQQLLELDADARVQAEDARYRRRAGLPAGQLPVRRNSRSGDAAADQRLQPAGDQRHRRQHLERFLVAVVQGSAVGRRDHVVPAVHRRAPQIHDAGRGTRVHASSVTRQRLVDGAVPAEQHDGALRRESVGGREDAFVQRFDPQDAVSAGSRQGFAPRREDSGHHRSRRRSAARIRIAAGVPESLEGVSPGLPQKTLTVKRALFPSLFSEDGIRLGPIPAGTPIGLLSNLNLMSEDPDPLKRAQHLEKVGALVAQILERLHKLGGNATSDQAKTVFADLVEPMLELSKCPDLVVNRGHLFGTDLSNDEKSALIEFLKTF